MKCDGCGDNISVADASKLDDVEKKVYHRRCWRAEQARRARAGRVVESVEVVEDRVQAALAESLRRGARASFDGMVPALRPDAEVPMSAGVAASFVIEEIMRPENAALRADLQRLMGSIQ